MSRLLTNAVAQKVRHGPRAICTPTLDTCVDLVRVGVNGMLSRKSGLQIATVGLEEDKISAYTGSTETALRGEYPQNEEIEEIKPTIKKNFFFKSQTIKEGKV